MHPAPTWWLVRTSPLSETNEPEPPLLKRTDASRTWSSHAWSGAQPYFCLSCLTGTLLYGHIPPSATADAARASTDTSTRHSGSKKRFIFFPLSNLISATCRFRGSAEPLETTSAIERTPDSFSFPRRLLLKQIIHV